ncbi:CbiQ family ECF transporter T component [Nesterenkonia sp.]|uniref:CbiQ family ECF transporter T component n=1 Tax=Nesterenkonia sp. TaxID=704201 RepID=UPI00260DCB0E|nr:CbiQ family ECF transporter T component [Nesterenkonia sp.]
MIPIYRPGSSALHRMPAGAKVAVLLAAGIAVALWRDSPWVAVAAWALAAVGYVLAFGARAGAAQLAVRMWRLKWLVLLIAVPQLLFLTAGEAAITTARILAVVILAGLFTLTTRVSDVMELVLRLVRPAERLGLGRWGFTAERAALAMSLTMRSVPVIFGFYQEIRRARQARGARTGPAAAAAMTTPLLVMTLQHAEETGEALAARGVR